LSLPENPAAVASEMGAEARLACHYAPEVQNGYNIATSLDDRREDVPEQVCGLKDLC